MVGSFVERRLGGLCREATKEINRLLDAYPAEKQQAEPLTINLTVNMEL